MSTATLLPFFALLLLAGCRPADSVPPASRAASPPLPAVICRFTDKPIVIDGSLDDAAWADAVEVTGFSLPWLPGNPAAAGATRA